MKTLGIAPWPLVVALLLAGCGRAPEGSSSSPAPGESAPKQTARAAAAPLRVLSGSENKILEPTLADFTRQSGIPIEMVYRGSVDIMLELQQGAADFHAVWPASTLWIDLSGNKEVRSPTSITRSPVVFGIKRSKAARLGLAAGQRLPIRRMIDLARAGQLRFLMTSPTQSNSGAMAYLGCLHALAGREDAIAAADLENPAVAQSVQDFLAAVDRTSASSGWLKDLYVSSPGLFDAMVNYESTIIEANQELTARNEEPLIVFYPADGQAIADSPLAFVGRPDNAREADFTKLRDYLMSPTVQSRLGELGRRTGLVGTETSTGAFRADWGLDPALILQPFPLPSAAVVRSALGLYQTTFKRPSLTAFVLDFSGSMEGIGERQLKSAMQLLLVEEEANKYLLRTGRRDALLVIPFDSAPREVQSAEGNDAAELERLRLFVQQQRVGGGTDIYAGARAALSELAARKEREDYQISIILMTDGKSKGDFDAFQRAWEGMPVPVFTIMFGDADPAQLDRISRLTRARSFDGRKDLVSAFREARGYN